MRFMTMSCLQLHQPLRNGDNISKVQGLRLMSLQITEVWNGSPSRNHSTAGKPDVPWNWIDMIFRSSTNQESRMASRMRVAGMRSTAMKRGGKTTNLLNMRLKRGSGLMAI